VKKAILPRLLSIRIQRAKQLVVHSDGHLRASSHEDQRRQRVTPMHQILRRAKRESAEEFLKLGFPPVRYLRKIAFGGSLNLFVTPKGGRYWRYCYRYGGKRRTLSLGIYPEVPIDRARSRHLEARQLLAAGVDPSLKREELRGTFRLRRR